jgi:predicted esterase YcpF (UPF0227 family)
VRPSIFPQLAEFASLRGNPVVIYSAMITEDSVHVLYEHLRRLGKTERLDLVLSTRGGSVITARQIALLLHEYVQHLTIMVPYRARSAGTLLCLGANELVLGPMAELGPIDSQISSAGPPPAEAPGMISAEEIRAFREMAEEWFGIEREEDRIQVLALVAQRVFPTSLASFYRFDKLVHQTAVELLEYQLPDAEEGKRQQIVGQLVGGYYAHDYVLSRAEARALGLQVRYASPQEEALLWELVQACHARVDEHPGGEEGVIGLIVGTGFYAQQVARRGGAPTWCLGSTDFNDGGQRDPVARKTWRRLLRAMVPKSMVSK